MIGLLGMFHFGLSVEEVANAFLPGKDPGGWIVTCLLGIAGSVLAGFFGRMIGLYGEGDVAGWIMSIIGAMLILYAYRAFQATSNTSDS